MNFLKIKTEVAKLLNLYDFETEAIIEGRDINEALIGGAINNGYTDEVIPMIRGAYPHYFETKGTMPNYTETFTASETSTGSTLISMSPVFSQGNVGDTVYNETDEETAVITAYTSSFEVELDTDIDDTWDDDSIKLFGKYLPLSGVDISSIRKIQIRATSTEEYITARPILEKDKDINQNTLSADEVCYYITSTKIDNKLVDAIRIYPDHTIPDDSAIEITYTEQPGAMEEGTDEPRLPLGNRDFLKWYAVRDASIIRDDKTKMKLAEQKILEGKSNLMNYFTPLTVDRPRKTPRSNRAYLILNREI